MGTLRLDVWGFRKVAEVSLGYRFGSFVDKDGVSRVFCSG